MDPDAIEADVFKVAVDYLLSAFAEITATVRGVYFSYFNQINVSYHN